MGGEATRCEGQIFEVALAGDRKWCTIAQNDAILRRDARQ